LSLPKIYIYFFGIFCEKHVAIHRLNISRGNSRPQLGGLKDDWCNTETNINFMSSYLRHSFVQVLIFHCGIGAGIKGKLQPTMLWTCSMGNMDLMPV
jgi:hypothetical protein